MMGLAPQVHNGCNQSDVDTVKKIAMALLSLLVGLANATEIYLPDTAQLE